ncbi:MAG: TIGR04255 family protein [Silvibacterium sp.]
MATVPSTAILSSLSEQEEEALFSEYPKVRYAKNPLESVVAEARFPPLLRIETEIPAKFQETLRGEFPLFQEIIPLSFATPEIMKIFQSSNVIPSAKTFTFTSADGGWSLALNRESISLTCRKYSRWNEFREKWEKTLTALHAVYEPQFLLRLGLRYRDVISKGRLGLQDVPWHDLLSRGIVGVVHTPIEPLLDTSWSQTVFKLQRGNTQVLLQHGLQPIPPSGEKCYIFDADFSTQSRTEPHHALDAFQYFNKRSWYFFRACIADRLHNAMQPESIEPSGT